MPYSAMHLFIPWEKATNVAVAARPGLVPQRCATYLTAFTTLTILLILWPVMGPASLPTALVFARLAVLDLTTYTLPNIYTVPLIAIGLTHAIVHGQSTPAFLPFIILLGLTPVLTRHVAQFGVGGGDLKLLAALFAFLPLTSACWAIAAGCLLWLPVAFAKPRAMVPFGVPLILGWVVLLRFPHLPNWLISTIS